MKVRKRSKLAAAGGSKKIEQKELRLPPDTDGFNDQRADFARTIVVVYRALTHSGQEEAVTDILNNLMHLCDRDPGFGNFEKELARAVQNYDWETEAD